MATDRNLFALALPIDAKLGAFPLQNLVHYQDDYIHNWQRVVRRVKTTV